MKHQMLFFMRQSLFQEMELWFPHNHCLRILRISQWAITTLLKWLWWCKTLANEKTVEEQLLSWFRSLLRWKLHINSGGSLVPWLRQESTRTCSSLVWLMQRQWIPGITCCCCSFFPYSRVLKIHCSQFWDEGQDQQKVKCSA